LLVFRYPSFLFLFFYLINPSARKSVLEPRKKHNIFLRGELKEGIPLLLPVWWTWMMSLELLSKLYPLVGQIVETKFYKSKVQTTGA
jgi:hypothetical protein